MRRPRPSVFLERRSYRQRRLRDAAQLLPLLGLALWGVPLLFSADGIPAPTSRVLLYIFGIWLGLVVIAAALARALDPVPGLDDAVDMMDDSEDADSPAPRPRPDLAPPDLAAPDAAPDAVPPDQTRTRPATGAD